MPDPAPEAPSIDSILDAGIAAEPLPVVEDNHYQSPGEVLANALSRLEDNPVAETPPVEAPVVAATPETPPVETPPAEPVEPADGEGLAHNWRLTFNSVDERRAAQLMRSGMSLPEAYQAIYGKEATPAATPTGEPVAAPVPVSDALNTATSRLDAIYSELEALAKEGGDVGITITPEVLALQKEAAQLTVTIPDLKADARAEARTEQRDFNAAFDTWQTEAVADFPDIAVPGTSLFAAVEKAVAAMPANDPLRSQPDCAYLLAARVAKQIGYVRPTAQPGAAPTPAPSPAPSPAQPRTITAVPGNAASSAHRVTVESGTPSAANLYQQAVTAGKGTLQSMLDGLDSVISGGNAPSPARLY